MLRQKKKLEAASVVVKTSCNKTKTKTKTKNKNSFFKTKPFKVIHGRRFWY